MRSTSTSSAKDSSAVRGQYPLRSFAELEVYAQQLRGDITERFSTPFFTGSAVNIEVIADKILDAAGYQLTYIDNPDFDDGNRKEYGRTNFTRKVVEIAINERIKDKTIRTTIAHELYHVLAHEKYALTAQIAAMPADLEKNAKDFARIFLLPAAEFKTRFKQLAAEHRITFNFFQVMDDSCENAFSLEEYIIPKLSSEFGIATFSIALRIKDLNLLGNRGLAQRLLLDRRPIYAH